MLQKCEIGPSIISATSLRHRELSMTSNKNDNRPNKVCGNYKVRFITALQLYLENQINDNTSGDST